MTNPDLSRTLRRMAEQYSQRIACHIFSHEMRVETFVAFAYAVASAVRREQQEQIERLPRWEAWDEAPVPGQMKQVRFGVKVVK